MKIRIIFLAFLLTGCQYHNMQKESLDKIHPEDAVPNPIVLRPADNNNLAVNCVANPCMTVKIIDVGQGSTGLALLPDGTSILIDAGGSGSSWASNVNTQITSLGITQIDYLILSHSDNDHINLINDITALDLSTLTAIHLSGEPSDYYYQNTAGRIFMSKIYTNPSSQRSIAQCNQNKKPGVNATIYCYGNATYGAALNQIGFPNDPTIGLYTYLLAVNVGSTTAPPTSSNAASLVFGITYNNEKLIFPGDAEGSTQIGMTANSLAAMYQDVTVYPLAHHGATTNGSNSTAWLTEVQANAYVSSSSWHTGWYHPSGQLIHNIRSNGNLNTRLMNFTQHYVFSSSKTTLPAYCYCDFQSSIMSTYTNGTGTFISDGVTWEYTSAENAKYGLSACPLTANYC